MMFLYEFLGMCRMRLEGEGLEPTSIQESPLQEAAPGLCQETQGTLRVSVGVAIFG